ncbi:MAG TPA: bifunctional adenosylcobinamide kinase/adenosylcobinamide-phosphate guanylyltransferase [Candidatus Binataceae bacterium]
MDRITLITGGARSGKSTHALALASAHGGPRRVFVATGQPLDDEMAARIAHHKTSRPPEFTTVEEPLNVAAALEALAGRADMVVLDCLTLWVANQMGINVPEDAFHFEAGHLATALRKAPFASIVVTDEVGSGIVPDNPTARQFRDYLGRTNQKIAAAADRVILMVAGLPMRVK